MKFWLSRVAGLLVLSVLIYACKDSCEDTVCEHGECIDGSCVCSNGYTGDSCNIESRSMFYGTYNVRDICSQTGISNYTVNISEVPGSLFEVQIANFANAFSNNVMADVTGNLITVPLQSPDGDGRSVAGSGTLYNQDSIQFSYTLSDVSGYANQCDNSSWKK